MDLSNILLMRFEVILLVVILLLIVGEIFISQAKKDAVIHLSIFLFGLHTAIGFLNLEEGRLFGGMFHTNAMIELFKNILNIGVLILLLQSGDWVKEKIMKNSRGTEFFILLFSSLLGMYFIISSTIFIIIIENIIDINKIHIMLQYRGAKKRPLFEFNFLKN